MERRNYFEMLGLDFDPPEEKQGVIKQALDDWKKKERESACRRGKSCAAQCDFR